MGRPATSVLSQRFCYAEDLAREGDAWICGATFGASSLDSVWHRPFVVCVGDVEGCGLLADG